MIKSFGTVTLPVLGDSIKNSPVSNIYSSPIPILGFHSFYQHLQILLSYSIPSTPPPCCPKYMFKTNHRKASYT